MALACRYLIQAASARYLITMTECKSLIVSSGGDRTRTCLTFRLAVFKTAVLPLCDPLRRVGIEEYSAW
jgi:hypothetical protein